MIARQPTLVFHEVDDSAHRFISAELDEEIEIVVYNARDRKAARAALRRFLEQLARQPATVFEGEEEDD